MKRIITLIFSFLPFLLFAQTSIYDIQYSTDAANGYPSPFATNVYPFYDGPDITTGGIVTAANFDEGRYFISSSNGGAWSGIYIYDNSNSPEVGDSIVITGEVSEYYGLTEIKNLLSFEVKSSSNPLPVPTSISTAQVTDEAYEGVYVEIINCSVSQSFDDYGNWKANDGSGQCLVSSGIFNLEDINFPLAVGYPFSSVKGVITDYYGVSILPRNVDDLQSGNDGFVLTSEDTYVEGVKNVDVLVNTGLLNKSTSITSYELNMTYDNSVFTFLGINQTGTLSESKTVTDNSTIGNISLNFSGSISCDDISTLIKLRFIPANDGDGNLQFSTSSINGSEVDYLSAGFLIASGIAECDYAKADTVSIVQRPLLNIPSIVAPGETLFIECFASETTTSWDAELFFNDITVDLTISQADYNSDLEKWTLQATIPSVDYYELYNLKVTASGGIVDSVANSVKVIDQYKTDYYFIQITDTHLIGHSFYGDEGYETDETEIDDLNEVIKDINLLNPEFVLLTGDLINEGELEDFECLRNHSKTVELLKNFEVPVYIVPGNHDLGGWDDTPPPQGTARQEWWRFFGWRQRVIPPVEEEYYVHDYSFDYGDVHYVGMESSDNYDSYMHDVYGDKGFIPSQLTWLNNDLASVGSKTKVLFYHFDFNGDIDLATLGADMALWGHEHKNTDDFTHPYNIGTANVCDGTRAYRVIRVSDGNLTPENTIYTNSSSQNLDISYSAENNGTSDYLEATITNNHDLSFNYGLVKFIMPKSTEGYNVTNGNLKQVIYNGSNNICYVEVIIPASGQVTTTIEKKTSNNITSIYEIQYTTEAGDGTYPSTLNGQTVNTGGIVTAVNYYGGRYFISSSEGGAWNGILVYDDNYSPSIGDSILITGQVTEYNGYTELINLSSFEVKTESNTLPLTAKISTVDVLTEAYEGVLVEIEDCYVSGDFNEYGTWMINDGSGDCEIRYGVYSLMYDEFTLINNYPFNYVIGVVGSNSNHNTIHPRGLSDIQSADDGFILITDDKSVSNNSLVSIPVKLSIIKPYENISNYTLKVQYNSEVFQYDGYDEANTISELGSIIDNLTEGNIELNYSGTTTCEKTDTLVKLNFTPITSGSANIQFNGTSINGFDLEYSIVGDLESTYENTTKVGDLNSNSLFKCYPNPFSEEIFIEYEILQKASVNISIYNSAGQLIKILINEIKNQGQYFVKWNGTNDSGAKVDSGVYFYKYILDGKLTAAEQMVFIK